MYRRERLHENLTVSMDKDVLRRLERLAEDRGKTFSKSRYVSNAVRERLLREGVE